jgi:hypothetical protein
METLMPTDAMIRRLSGKRYEGRGRCVAIIRQVVGRKAAMASQPSDWWRSEVEYQ